MVALGGLMSGRLVLSKAGAAAAAVTRVMRSWVRPLGTEPPEELVDDAAGGSPNLVGTVGVVVDVDGGVVPGALLHAVDGVIVEGAEGHLNDLGHLLGAGAEEDGWRGRAILGAVDFEPGDNRGYDEAADGHVDVPQRGDYLQKVGVDTKFLVGLAQGGVDGVRVGGVLGAAGEGNLALVVLYGVGAPGEDEVVLAGARIEEDQH